MPELTTVKSFLAIALIARSAIALFCFGAFAKSFPLYYYSLLSLTQVDFIHFVY